MSILFGRKNETITESTEEGLANLLICNALSKHLTRDQLRDFMQSPEYRLLLSKNIVQEGTMHAIQEGKEVDEDIAITAINIAKNKNDSRVEDVVKLKQQLDSKIEDILVDYGDTAKIAVDVVRDEAIGKVPTLKEIEPEETQSEEE